MPPHSPDFDASFTPSTGMPSFHQLSLAAGLLELESQMSVASTFGFSSSGSTRILTVSGATVERNKQKRNVLVSIRIVRSPTLATQFRCCVIVIL